MFTRQHHITVAQLLKSERNNTEPLPGGLAMAYEREMIGQARHDTIDNLERGLMNMFEDDNSRFNRQRFLNASR